MKLLDLLITAIALSMDAFAVSIGKGLSVKRLKASHCLITGAYFGGFQALMPLLGFLLASSFASYIQKFDHWIACVLLVLIGANMLREAFSKEEEQGNDSFSFRVMLPLAIATSIDALATGRDVRHDGRQYLDRHCHYGPDDVRVLRGGCQDR